MSDLDEQDNSLEGKLERYLVAYRWEHIDCDEAIAQIKQAFAEAGYEDLTMPPITVFHSNGDTYEIKRKRPVMRKWSVDASGVTSQLEVMTGRDWYERFYELIKDHGFYEEVSKQFVIMAARRAAGVE
jgi:hypothetical protein